MQQLALQTPVSNAYPTKIKALDRDARDASHETGGGELALFGDDGLGFDDVVEALNPLQHIPGVSSLYQTSTGTTLNPIVSIASGALLGGPVGAGLAVANIVFEAATGDSPLGHALSLFDDENAITSTVANASRAYLNAGGLSSTSN